jgi:type IX secretion system PorP/SprF family membrane protein
MNSGTLFAQDPHYSQFFNAPLLENPANTGNSNSLSRLVLNYRNQWKAVSKPFTTYSASYDGMFSKSMFKNRRFGYGISCMRDKAGDSEFGFASVAVSGSYSMALTKARDHWVTIGLQADFVQKSILYTALRFGDQYDGYQYDPNINSSEKFAGERFSYPDFNTGITWKYIRNNGQHYFAGLAIHHLSRPNQSFYENESIPLKQKISINTAARFSLNELNSIQPMMSWHHQGPYHELLFGAQFIHHQTETGFPMGFNAGAMNRWNDALVFFAGIQWQQLNFTMSYDLNYSKLQPSSDLRGGPEFSLILLFGKTDFTLTRQLSCPIF